MRIWDIDPKMLCRNHLLGEHRELHAIWSILTNKKKGYSRHPETLRWKGKLGALYLRHERLIRELKKRGYGHESCLERNLASGVLRQRKFVHTVKEQLVILRKKKCGCNVRIDEE